MTNLKDIRRLLPVLEMAFQAEQVKMGKVARRITELKAQLSALERPPAPSPDTISPATMAGADLRWAAWAQARKSLINQELALAMRDRDAARIQMAQALSKREAAREMEARSFLAQQQKIARRSS